MGLLYEHMYLVPKDRYEQLAAAAAASKSSASQNKSSCASTGDTLNGEVSGHGQVNHIEIGEGGRVTIRPNQQGVTVDQPSSFSSSLNRRKSAIVSNAKRREEEREAGSTLGERDVEEAAEPGVEEPAEPAADDDVFPNEDRANDIVDTAEDDADRELEMGEETLADDESPDDNAMFDFDAQDEVDVPRVISGTRSFETQTDPPPSLKETSSQTNPPPSMADATMQFYAPSHTVEVQTEPRGSEASTQTDPPPASREFGQQLTPQMLGTSREFGQQLTPQMLGMLEKVSPAMVDVATVTDIPYARINDGVSAREKMRTLRDLSLAALKHRSGLQGVRLYKNPNVVRAATVAPASPRMEVEPSSSAPPRMEVDASHSSSGRASRPTQRRTRPYVIPLRTRKPEVNPSPAAPQPMDQEDKTSQTPAKTTPKPQKPKLDKRSRSRRTPIRKSSPSPIKKNSKKSQPPTKKPPSTKPAQVKRSRSKSVSDASTQSKTKRAVVENKKKQLLESIGAEVAEETGKKEEEEAVKERLAALRGTPRKKVKRLAKEMNFPEEIDIRSGRSVTKKQKPEKH